MSCRGLYLTHAPVRGKGKTMRWLNIGLRTAHLGAMGILLGGHAFDVAPERLKVVLWLTLGTGVLLAAVGGRASPSMVPPGAGHHGHGEAGS